MIIKQKLNPYLVKEILVQLDGEMICSEGVCQLNGFQVEKGIGTIEIRLSPQRKPEIFVEYAPSVITRETALMLDLKKISDLMNTVESEK
ncbi:hypothetical protein [Halalkalibacter hemicellulosilyticus]|uniref:Uncharacterized protein n=1 Tax=Halalkalibacter hemicellulosilyticusJCM 9152 TaxID=1236971 RepID=W4QK22_9BACI|nr:hypothetical protein [Halalkalibacter hemicellulosilyticus]GAE32411.1 hypothetical protein JCM9152_3945 [Halalkalibacter hemicellulosilyticusJCM 9152]